MTMSTCCATVIRSPTHRHAPSAPRRSRFWAKDVPQVDERRSHGCGERPVTRVRDADEHDLARAEQLLGRDKRGIPDELVRAVHDRAVETQDLRELVRQRL